MEFISPTGLANRNIYQRPHLRPPQRHAAIVHVKIQPVPKIIDFRQGTGTLIGAAIVAKVQRDNYMLLIGGIGSNAGSPFLTGRL